MCDQEQEGFTSWQAQTAFRRQPPPCMQVCSRRSWEILWFLCQSCFDANGRALLAVSSLSVSTFTLGPVCQQSILRIEWFLIHASLMWPRVLNTVAFSCLLFPSTSLLLTFSPVEVWTITGWIWVSWHCLEGKLTDLEETIACGSRAAALVC